MKPCIGIMQGRLFPPMEGRFQCFPRDHWADEFPRAAEAGLDCIEWIYDLYGADVNPLASDEGVDRLKRLSAKHGVAVRSVCADYFMDKPLLRTSPSELADRVASLRWLIQRSELLSVQHIVVPFVDASRIETPGEMESVVSTLSAVLPSAEAAGIELHLETSLTPESFAGLLARVPHALLKANYDSGNSSSLGYRPREEFAAYGERIGSVHIKDRLNKGSTVSLGTGDADFGALFECLKKIDYSRHYILQAARGEPGNEVSWASRNRSWLEERLRK